MRLLQKSVLGPVQDNVYISSNLCFDSQKIGSGDHASGACSESYAGHRAPASAPCIFLLIAQDATHVALIAFLGKWCSRLGAVHIPRLTRIAVLRLYS